MGDLLVSVDEITLRLPTAVENALKADLEAEFGAARDTATAAAAAAEEDAATIDATIADWTLNTSDNSVGSLLTTAPVVRKNLVRDPRATLTGSWAAGAGTGGVATETAITGAVDGPVLPDGTTCSTYMRYTFTTADTGVATKYVQYALATGDDWSPDYPLGTNLATVIMVRSSRARTGYPRSITRLGAGGAETAEVSGATVSIPANTWVPLTQFLTTTAAFDRVSVRGYFPGEIAQVGDTFDVTCAMAEPGATAIGPYTDGSLLPTPTRFRAWSGAVNGSTSVEYVRTATQAGADTATLTPVLTANGVADDSTALLASATAAVALGLPLSLPAEKTIALASRVNLPAGLVLHTNDAKFKGLTATGDFLLTVDANTQIVGDLRVEVAAGANVRGVYLAGTDITVGAIEVTAPAAGAGAGDLNDNAVAINAATGVRVGAIKCNNFDFPIKVTSSTNIQVGRIETIGYVRGVYLSNVVDMTVQSGLAHTASPNASISPGHNALLIDATAHDATREIRFNNYVVRDSGEHGIRIGGNKRVRNVWFNECSIFNVGGCGIKVLGGAEVDANYHENIFIQSVLVEDAGQSAGNAAGVMLQFVKNATVTDPIVRKRSKTYSAAHGVEIQAAENILVTNPIITDTLTACYEVSFVLGNCTNVRLSGGLMSSATGSGVLIDYTNRTFRRVSVENHPQIDISGAGFAVNLINSGAGSVVGGSWITWQSVQAAASQYTGTLSGWFCDVRAAFTGDPGFKNGSTWIDNATGQIRIRNANVWKTPTLV